VAPLIGIEPTIDNITYLFSEFEPTSTIGIVNSISNLVALCPNHYWELDNGIIDEKSLREDSNLQLPT
jgi:hypothetical protein